MHHLFSFNFYKHLMYKFQSLHVILYEIVSKFSELIILIYTDKNEHFWCLKTFVHKVILYFKKKFSNFPNNLKNKILFSSRYFHFTIFTRLKSCKLWILKHSLCNAYIKNILSELWNLISFAKYIISHVPKSDIFQIWTEKKRKFSASSNKTQILW